MTVNPIGSTTTAYAVSTTSVSSTTPTGSTTATSSTTASTTVSSTTSSTTVNYSSATASTTCSTTVSYGGASTTANVINTAVNSSSTTPNTSVGRVEEPIVSTTEYPYLQHLGGDACKQLETFLVEFGYDNVVDGTYVYAIDSFKKAVGLEEYSSYGSVVIGKIQEVHDYVKSGRFDVEMTELGFYNADNKIVAPDSVKADSAPGSRRKALENFSRVYGIDKLGRAYSCYQTLLNSERAQKAMDTLGVRTERQKINFCKSWTFLKIGMEYSDELASALVGNWFSEASFSETNRQGTNSIQHFSKHLVQYIMI